jgi:hypothetical protein
MRTASVDEKVPCISSSVLVKINGIPGASSDRPSDLQVEDLRERKAAKWRFPQDRYRLPDWHLEPAIPMPIDLEKKHGLAAVSMYPTEAFFDINMFPVKKKQFRFQ